MTRRLPRALVVAACAAAAVPAPAPAAAKPSISSAAAFVFQPDTQDVVFARRPAARRAIASTTKIMTALVALDELELRRTYTLPSYAAAPGESVIGLQGGERMTFADLLRAMMLPSANDAAHDVAVLAAGSVGAFVRQMNRRAKELGLRNTHFSTPVGLDDPANYSTAEDLVKLALLLRRSSFVREIVDQPRATLRSGARPRVVVNRNDLVARYPFVTGIKTGHTIDAGYVLVGSASSGGVPVVSAVLGAPSEAARDADTLALLRYGLARYRRVAAVRAGEVLARVPVGEQGDALAPLAALRTLRAVARRDEKLQTRLVGVPAQVDGPLPEGARVGTVQALRRGSVVASAPLVTARAVPAPSAPQKVRSWIARPGTLALLAFLAGCTVALVLLRRRVVRRQGSRERAST